MTARDARPTSCGAMGIQTVTGANQRAGFFASTLAEIWEPDARETDAWEADTEYGSAGNCPLAAWMSFRSSMQFVCNAFTHPSKVSCSRSCRETFVACRSLIGFTCRAVGTTKTTTQTTAIKAAATPPTNHGFISRHSPAAATLGCKNKRVKSRSPFLGRFFVGKRGESLARSCNAAGNRALAEPN